MNDYLEFLKIATPDDLTDNIIKKIESMVRNSKEYRGFLSYIKEYLSIRNCAFFEDIDFVDNNLSIEFHHCVWTLYDIVVIVASKMLSELQTGEYLLTFDIAKQVIVEHLEDRIPGVMLSKTIHEMVHKKLKEIKKDSKEVHLGDYKNFIKDYYEFILERDIETIKNFLPNDKSLEVQKLWEELNCLE